MRILPGDLADALGRGELSERSKAALFLLGLLLPPFVAPGSMRTPPGDFLYIVGVFLSLTIAGVWLCYRANQAGDGRNVVERMVCLSPTLWIAAYATYYLALIGFAKFGAPNFGPPQTPEEFRAFASFATISTYFYTGAFLTCYALYLLLLRHYVRRAASEGAKSSGPA